MLRPTSFQPQEEYPRTMHRITLTVAGLLLSASFAFAQTERTEPTYDALRAYLGDTSVDCLIANRDAMREAASADLETLRTLQQTLRQTRRDGGDTTAIESEIGEVRTSLEATRSQYGELAQACVDPSSVADLVAAEALMDEVRQAVSLLAVESTREVPEGFGGRGYGPGRGRR